MNRIIMLVGIAGLSVAVSGQEYAAARDQYGRVIYDRCGGVYYTRVQPAVYVAPEPVYIEPAPVYVARATTVYVQPGTLDTLSQAVDIGVGLSYIYRTFDNSKFDNYRVDHYYHGGGHHRDGHHRGGHRGGDH